MDQNIFKNDQDYWLVAENIKDIYMSDGSLATLLDFERVLDELDLYAFKNWDLGELVAGPEIGKYKVSCIFMPTRSQPRWPRRRSTPGDARTVADPRQRPVGHSCTSSMRVPSASFGWMKATVVPREPGRGASSSTRKP